MGDYILVGKHKRCVKWLPTNVDGTLSLETLQSAFPHSTGMCFKIQGECFVIRIQNEFFYPPAGGWNRHDYEPIFDNDAHYEDDDDFEGKNNHDDYNNCDKYEEEYDESDYEHDDDYDNTRQWEENPEPEDYSDIIYNIMQKDKQREGYDEWESSEDDE